MTKMRMNVTVMYVCVEAAVTVKINELPREWEHTQKHTQTHTSSEVIYRLYCEIFYNYYCDVKYFFISYIFMSWTPGVYNMERRKRLTLILDPHPVFCFFFFPWWTQIVDAVFEVCLSLITDSGLSSLVMGHSKDSV